MVTSTRGGIWRIKRLGKGLGLQMENACALMCSIRRRDKSPHRAEDNPIWRQGRIRRS